MQLSVRQRRALEAICDTLAPGGDGVPSASDLGVPQAMVDAAAMNPREPERRQFLQLLSAWDSALLTALGGGGARRLTGLGARAARAGAAVVVRLSRDTAPGGVPDAAQGRAADLPHAPGHRRWLEPRVGRDRLPGAAGTAGGPAAEGAAAPDDRRRHRARVRRLRGRLGRGGGTAAGVLATAGLDVVVLEAARQRPRPATRRARPGTSAAWWCATRRASPPPRASTR
jgi:long-chain-alcohol oxidase